MKGNDFFHYSFSLGRLLLEASAAICTDTQWLYGKLGPAARSPLVRHLGSRFSNSAQPSDDCSPIWLLSRVRATPLNFSWILNPQKLWDNKSLLFKLLSLRNINSLHSNENTVEEEGRQKRKKKEGRKSNGKNAAYKTFLYSTAKKITQRITKNHRSHNELGRCQINIFGAQNVIVSVRISQKCCII